MATYTVSTDNAEIARGMVAIVAMFEGEVGDWIMMNDVIKPLRQILARLGECDVDELLKHVDDMDMLIDDIMLTRDWLLTAFNEKRSREAAKETKE